MGGGHPWLRERMDDPVVPTRPRNDDHCDRLARTPFVTEIAFANLGLAVAGFRALHAGPRERITIGLTAGMFLWGAVLGHVYQSVAHGNWSPGNTGGVLVYDMAIPAVMIILAVLSRRAGDGADTAPARSAARPTAPEAVH